MVPMTLKDSHYMLRYVPASKYATLEYKNNTFIEVWNVNNPLNPVMVDVIDKTSFNTDQLNIG
jgi:hypothetical protein